MVDLGQHHRADAHRGQRRGGAAAAPEAVEAFVAGKPRNDDTAKPPAKWRSRAPWRCPQRLQDSADAQPGEARHPRRGQRMGIDFLTWGVSPWGQSVLTHISWDLLWASLFAGVVFLVAHAVYMLLSAHRKRPTAETDALEARLARACRAKIQRHGSGGAHVPLGHGGVDVHAAVHGVPADRRRAVRLGAVALDRRPRARPRRSSFTSSTPRSSWTSGRSGSARRTSRSSRPR